LISKPHLAAAMCWVVFLSRRRGSNSWPADRNSSSCSVNYVRTY